MIYYQGHEGDFIFGKKTISYFLEMGYTIFSFSLPLLGKNNKPNIISEKFGSIEFTTNHEYFKFLPHPLYYFIAPVSIMLNYSKSFKFTNVSMDGISGGGWATTITSAIDDRINFSFPVAGSYPNAIRFIRPENNFGDFEQTFLPLIQTLDYLDLHILGCVGIKRSQVQILNLYDPCCFNGYEFELYENLIITETKKYDNAKFRIYSDKLNKSHSISENALKVISDEINLQSQ